MNLSQASILLFAATASMPSPSVGLEVSSSSALLQSSTHEKSRRLGKRTERSKKKKRMFGGSSSSGDELLPPFTNPEPKDVCIQEMQAYKIKGSATPIVGPTKDNPVCPPGTLLGAYVELGVRGLHSHSMTIFRVWPHPPRALLLVGNGGSIVTFPSALGLRN